MQSTPDVRNATSLKAEKGMMLADPDNPLVCLCMEITRADFLGAMTENRNLEYGALLEKIGAGMKCTACRLDLELLYTDNFDRCVGQIATTQTLNTDKKLSIKDRLYKLLDRFSPMVPRRLSNTVPVLRHKGVRQYVLVCNDPPLYQNTLPEPLDLRLILRDAGGRIRADQQYVVTTDRPLDLEVSELLPASPDNQPTIGSIQVMRSWRHPTQRGTTRPQILIEAPGGCSAVHTTGPNGPGATWFTCLARPGEDRALLGIVNPIGTKLKISISYPFAEGVSPEERETVTVPAHGSILHEVRLPEATAAVLREKPFGVKCEAEGMHKCYLITASPELDRFAIDHPAAA